MRHVSGDPFIGLKLGDAFRVGALGAYESLIRGSATLREAIDRAERYERVVDELTRISLVDYTDRVGLRLWRMGDFPHAAPSIECLFAVLFRALPTLWSGSQRLHEVHFEHGGPADTSEYVRRFACPVRFFQPHNEIVFARALLDVPKHSRLH